MDKMTEIKKWCDQYKLCRGCPLVGQCIAPLANADSPAWAEWIGSMHRKIKAAQV